MDIEGVLPNRDFPDYTPFSQYINSLYFQYFSSNLKEEILNGNSVNACKSHFEELVSLNNDLQYAYVEVFDHDNEFWCLQKSDGDVIFDFYIILNTSEVIFFFIRKSP